MFEFTDNDFHHISILICSQEWYVNFQYFIYLGQLIRSICMFADLHVLGSAQRGALLQDFPEILVALNGLVWNEFVLGQVYLCWDLLRLILNTIPEVPSIQPGLTTRKVFQS